MQYSTPILAVFMILFLVEINPANSSPRLPQEKRDARGGIRSFIKTSAKFYLDIILNILTISCRV